MIKPIIATDPFELNNSQTETSDKRFTSLVNFIKYSESYDVQKTLYKKINQMWHIVESSSAFKVLKEG